MNSPNCSRTQATASWSVSFAELGTNFVETQLAQSLLMQTKFGPVLKVAEQFCEGVGEGIR